MYVYTRTELVFFRLPHQWLLTCPKVSGTCLRIKPRLNHLETSLIWMLLWIRSHYWQEVDQSFLNSKEHQQQPQPKGKSNEENAVVDVDRTSTEKTFLITKVTSDRLHFSTDQFRPRKVELPLSTLTTSKFAAFFNHTRHLELKKLTFDVFQDFEIILTGFFGAF